MKKTTLSFLLIICSYFAKGQINQHTRPAGNTLEQHQSTDFGALYNLAKAKRDMDLVREKEQLNSYKQLYNSFNNFKYAKDGVYKSVIIVNDVFIRDAIIEVKDNKINSLQLDKIFTVNNGLRITSEISKAHSKVFLTIDSRLYPTDVYLESLFSVMAVTYKLKTLPFNTGVYDAPNFATNKEIFQINSSSILKYIKPSENGFYEINYNGRVGYILNTKVEEL